MYYNNYLKLVGNDHTPTQQQDTTLTEGLVY